MMTMVAVFEKKKEVVESNTDKELPSNNCATIGKKEQTINANTKNNEELPPATISRAYNPSSHLLHYRRRSN
tara:strand:- start:759 stop:974 length:216 start_codon:yes stop_codon:yes gene_type:complete